MLFANIREIFNLLLSVKYTHDKDAVYDYSTQPRPCHNFVFMLEGEAEIHSDNQRFHLQQGQILYIPQNATYSCRWFAKPKAVFHSLHFSFRAPLDPLSDKRIPVQILPCADVQAAYALLKEIDLLQFSKDSKSFLVLSDFYALCAKLFADVKIQPSDVKNKTVFPAVRYIEQHYKSDLSVEQLAALCFLSPSRFHFLFKRQMGVSPIVYKNRLALQCAAQELLSDPKKTIAAVAQTHGFPCTIYFQRLFKRLMGKTPSQYRKDGQPL